MRKMLVEVGYLAGAVDSIWFLYQSCLQTDPRFAKKQTLYLTHSPEGCGIWRATRGLSPQYPARPYLNPFNQQIQATGT